jgi:Leucine-rich repeat (LRR) protein
VLPGGQVHFPDPNLRAAVAEALGKSANEPITLQEIQGLRILEARNKNIHDLSGLQFATDLTSLTIVGTLVSDLSPIAALIALRGLWIRHNQISDISPIRGLTNLTHLDIDDNRVSNISPVRNLKNLIDLRIDRNKIADLSPIARLINLEYISFSKNEITDISPLAELINLKILYFNQTRVSDLSPLAGLTNLKVIRSWGSPLSDLSPLANLTNLERIDICGAEISDLSPLAALPGLKELYLVNVGNSDISSLSKLTGLSRLNLAENNISDISALAGLTNLKWLAVNHNNITDFSPLDRLRENTKIVWYDNPGFPKGGPKIEGPWLWVVLPDTALNSGRDLLSEATDGRVTEEKIATNGATVGKPVGAEMWTSHKLPPIGRENIKDMFNHDIPDGVIYGVVSLYSPRRQDTTMFVGSEHGVKVWINGGLIHARLQERHGQDFSEFFPVTLKQGRNVVLVAIGSRPSRTNGFFGFAPGTEYSVVSGVDYAFSDSPIHIGDTFTFDVRAENVSSLAGWQFDIAFDPSVLGAVDVSEGDFLKSDGGTTFFQSGRIDNAAGKITGLIAGRISEGGVSGSGSVLQVRFKAKTEGETTVALQNFLFGSVTEESIPAAPLEIHINVEEQLLTGDVNRDGVVNILDLIRVAQQLGKRVYADSPEDINGDGIVNIFDLTLVAQGIAGAAAPPAQGIDSTTIQMWISEARLANDSSLLFRQGIANLETLLATLIPKETALLANYPNPFNPETWIPYQLSVPSEVTLTIYDMNGGVVRRLEMGHQPAGMYWSRNSALYWDGRNQRGESVASGLYFYALRAGDFTATRKMLVGK